MTLMEAVIGIGIMAGAGTVATSVTVLTLDSMRREEVYKNRRQLTSEVSNSLSNPKKLRRGLGGPQATALIACLANPTNPTDPQPDCAVTAGFVPFTARASVRDDDTVAEITDNGLGCYSVKGVKGTPVAGVCPVDSPVRVVTEYQVRCPGVGRTTCPSNQAIVVLRYTISPEAGAAEKDLFRPIQTVQIVQARSLWGDPNELGEGASAVELTGEPNKQIKACGAGQIMTGTNTAGDPICESLTDVTQRCAAGTVFKGFTVDGTTGKLVASCLNVTCPAGQVLSTVTAGGAPTCVAINPTNQTCNMGNAAAPGTFLIGLDIATAAPVCRPKACAPGTIYARTEADGSVTCVSTAWIPKCPTGTCFSPPDPTPPAIGTFYSDSSTPAVAVGYDGMPWIYEWINGAPTKAYRMTFKNFTGDTTPTPTVTGMFRDNRGSGVKTCQLNGAINDSTRHRCTHTWRYITRAMGNCPNNINSSTFQGYTYIGGNLCEYQTRTCNLEWGLYCSNCTSWNPIAPFNCIASTSYNCWSCRGNYTAWATNYVDSERSSSATENYPPVGYDFQNGTSGAGSANCTPPGGYTAHSGNVSGYPTGYAVGTRYNDTYSAVVRASCNYDYAP